jgi:hypothetical protein
VLLPEVEQPDSYEPEAEAQLCPPPPRLHPLPRPPPLSLSANWLLAKQLDKHKEMLKVLKDANQRGDMEAFRRIVVVRSAELARVINEVNTGSYSISDKQKLLVPLQQEKDWADNAIVGMHIAFQTSAINFDKTLNQPYPLIVTESRLSNLVSHDYKISKLQEPDRRQEGVPFIF